MAPFLKTLLQFKFLRQPITCFEISREGRPLKRISLQDYFKFLKENPEIEVEGQRIPLKEIEVKRLFPRPEELNDVSTTVWSFPKRGSWGTHRGNYRGNWPPQMARALIERYSSPGDLVLDPMVGSGTTMIEAKLLGRNGIGVDVNLKALMLTMHRIFYLEKGIEKALASSLLSEEDKEALRRAKESKIELYLGDVRNLEEIEDESVDLIATHPPYFNIIRYGKKEPKDLSRTRKLEEYIRGIREAASELYRVLKPGKICAILIGDTRMHRRYVPISAYVLLSFLDAGFCLKEEVIKIQHKMKKTREVWKRGKRDFLLIYHEKLLIFEKAKDEKKLKYSFLNPDVLREALRDSFKG